MSRTGRTQSPSEDAPKSGGDGKILGVDRNTAIIVAIVLGALILVLIYWRTRPKKESSDPHKHHVINNGCKTDAECPTGKHCKTSSGLCVECLGDGQCDGNENGNRCDTAANKCVQCNSNSDCNEGQECIGHVCSPPPPLV